MTEVEIRLECLKLANDICKSHNVPYGADELQAEAEKVWKVLYPKLLRNNTVPVDSEWIGPKSFQDGMKAEREKLYIRPQTKL